MSIAELIILEILLGGMLLGFVTILAINIRMLKEIRQDQKEIEEQIKVKTRNDWSRKYN